ncbi:MAG: glycosyltransferase family 4 protein, partial [Methanobacteriaceae archaeon]|nr:glycosyltransferase family 4 protein [Methanobacteriaceae archaeon]
IIKAHKIYYYIPFLAIIKLDLELRKVKPGIIHVQGSNVSPYLFYALLLKRYKKIVTYHSYPSRELVAHGRLKENSVKYTFLRLFEKFTFSKSDRIITVTKSLKNWLSEDFDSEDKIFTIPNGVNTIKFDYKIDNNYIMNKLNLSNDEYIIFHAKAFVPNNGQEYIIKAMPEILRHYKNVKLILAGDGPTKSKLVELSKKLKIFNNVLFLGEVPHEEIPQLMSASNVVVVPSVQMNGFEEGSSIFSLEAMAMKKPVIASNVGGFKDSIVNGKNGLLIPDKNSDAIAHNILKLIKDPIFADKLAENALNYVKNERNWSKIAKDTLKIYESISN